MSSERTAAQDAFGRAIARFESAERASYMADAAMRRAEEVGLDVVALNQRGIDADAFFSVKLGAISDRLAALESGAAVRPPEREPGEDAKAIARIDLGMCANCDHPHSEHLTPKGRPAACQVHFANGTWCTCTEFIAAELVPRAEAAIDPVRAVIAHAFRLVWYAPPNQYKATVLGGLREAFLFSCEDGLTDDELSDALMTYGRQP